MSDEPTITCPVCGWTSYNPNDIREGYCGHCHDWTTPKMTETKMAKLLVEVQWGIIPGMVDGNRQWGYSREEVEAALDEGHWRYGERGAWQKLLDPAYAEFDERMNPQSHNWVTLTWLWL
jgi:hypothetical protein